MVRKYEDMFKDYLNWYVTKTGDEEYLPELYLNGEEEEVKVRKASLWNEILELCYNPINGIYWFKKFILGDITYAGYPAPIRFNKLWFEWAKKANRGDHITIICPRQHSKTTFWAVCQPIYRGSLFEQYNTLIESASEEQAIAILTQIVRIVDNNEFLISKKPKAGKWSSTEIAYNGGKIVARGIGSEVRGGTYDYIVIDDILRSDNKLSDEDIENFIDEELEPMILVRGGQMVIVGTRKSDTDIFNTIMERIDAGAGGWQLFPYDAIIDEEKHLVLCPDRFTWEQLMAKKAIMGSRKFDKEFRGKVYSSGSQLFPAELRKRAMEIGRTWKLYSASQTSDANKWFYYIGIDVARAGTASADFTVATVIAFNSETQEKRIVWIWRKKGMKISEQVEEIAEISRNFGNPPILVEQNNIGQDFIDVMVDNYNLHVESFTTGAKGNKKDDLIRFLINSFENEKIIMPTGNEFSKEHMDILNKELDRFVVEITRAGNEVMKGSGHSHDDMIMSLALANRCSQSYGYVPFSSSIDNKYTTELERFAVTEDISQVMRL